MKDQRNTVKDIELKFNKQQRRAFRNPWFWISAAALVIIPITAFAWISNDNYNNYMARKGCQVVNVLDNGTNVWECERGR